MIGTIQNDELQMQRLGAQRHLYSKAKRVFVWHALLAGPVVVAAAFVVLFRPEFRVYAASWALLVSICDLGWLTPWQKSLRSAGAGIQEAFDCDVLQLKWNSLKAGKQPDPELVRAESAKYERRARKLATLRNWYPPIVDQLPLEFGRIICQRTNCWWDAAQRRHYAAWLVGLVLCMTLLVCVLALTRGATLEVLLVGGILPMSPAALICWRQVADQREAANRLDRLKEHCDVIWNAALSKKGKSSLEAMSRNLQDEILENRRKAPPVFDFIFARLRSDYENRMNYSADYYVSVAKVALAAQ